MNILIVELMTSRKEMRQVFWRPCLWRVRVGEACVASGVCVGLVGILHPATSQLFSSAPFFTCSLHLTASHPSLVAALVLPFPVCAVACLELQALKLMVLRLPLGVSKTGNNRFIKCFSLYILRTMQSVWLKYVLLTNQRLSLENDFPCVILSVVWTPRASIHLQVKLFFASLAHFLLFAMICFKSISQFSLAFRFCGLHSKKLITVVIEETWVVY